MVKPKLELRVINSLIENGHFFMVEVVHLLPEDVQQSIANDAVPSSWYDKMKDRVEDLKSGHLSTDSSDNHDGAIHWFEGEFVWESVHGLWGSSSCKSY